VGRGCRILLGDVGDVGAAAIDGSGAGEKQAVDSGFAGELEDVAGAFEDGFGELVCRRVGLLATGVGGGVEDEGMVLGGEGEGANVAGEQGDGGSAVMCGVFSGEGFGVAREHGGAGVERELAVGVEEGFEQPVTEEAGASGDEDALVAERMPDLVGVGEDVVKIGGLEGGLVDCVVGEDLLHGFDGLRELLADEIFQGWLRGCSELAGQLS